MADRLIKIKEVHVVDSEQAGTSPFREVQGTFEEEGRFVDRTLDFITRCTHGHSIRTAQQLRGQCVTCGRYLGC